jgi:hypothetical protein
LCGVIIFFALLLSLKANVRLEFKDSLVLSISVLFIKINISPEKKKPVNYKEYTYAKHQKRLQKKYQAYLKKQEKKRIKAEKKAQKKAERKAETAEQKKARKNAPKRSVADWIDIAVGILAIFFNKFFHRLHIKVARLKVNVATGDAASTAIAYGAIVQSVAYLIEMLNRITNVDGLQKADIDVVPDYLSDKTSLDLCFVFSLRVWHLFDILFGIIIKAIKKFISTDPARKNKYSTTRKRNAHKKRKKHKPIPQATTN